MRPGDAKPAFEAVFGADVRAERVQDVERLQELLVELAFAPVRVADQFRAP